MIRLTHMGVGYWTLDAVEEDLYYKIKNGDPVTSQNKAELRDALTRLRRNGLIENHGTRSQPIWKLSTDWEKRAWKIKIVGVPLEMSDAYRMKQLRSGLFAR